MGLSSLMLQASSELRHGRGPCGRFEDGLGGQPGARVGAPGRPGGGV